MCGSLMECSFTRIKTEWERNALDYDSIYFCESVSAQDCAFLWRYTKSKEPKFQGLSLILLIIICEQQDCKRNAAKLWFSKFVKVKKKRQRHLCLVKDEGIGDSLQRMQHVLIGDVESTIRGEIKRIDSVCTTCYS